MTDDDRNELCRAFSDKYKRPAMIMRRKSPPTWRVMVLDGYLRRGAEDGHDADGAALYGVAKAAKTYDPTRGVKFVTWAVENLFLEVRTFYAKAAHTLGSAVFVLGAGLGRPDRAEGGGWDAVAPVLDRDDASDRGAVEFLLSRLTRPGAASVAACFGLRGELPKTRKEVGQDQGVTPQSIQANVVCAMKRLRADGRNWAAAGLDFPGEAGGRG